jgi:ribosomal protein L32
MGSNRYDKVLTKMKKIKKFGGSFLVRSKTTGKLSPAHRVSKENPEYKGKQIINA